MSHLTKAMDGIKLAAQDIGGIGELARRAGVSVDAARRIVRDPAIPIQNLRALEDAAREVLGDRMP